LPSTYLHAFAGGASEKRFIERLGDLFHEGYLDRPAEQWRFADARCRPVVHELGRGGNAALETNAASATEPITWLRHGPHRQFEHSLMICEVLASIELATRGRDDIRFIPWPEILAKAPESTRHSAKPYVLSAAGGEAVVPDALFGLEYRHDGRKSYRFFALEVDRGTMPIARVSKHGTSILAKLRLYQSLLERGVHRTRLGTPNLLILTVTIGANRAAEIAACLGAQASEMPEILFQAISGSNSLIQPATGLLSELWCRSRLPPLQIDR
jgi:hypothetical protein